MSDLSADDEDNVPVAPAVIRCNLASWKEIAGITLVEEEHRLIVIDPGLRSMRVIVNVHRLWQQPKAGLQNMIQGIDDNFYPFAVSMCLNDSHRTLITSPKSGCVFLTEISQDLLC